MVLGAVLTVTAAYLMYQWADTESIAFGFVGSRRSMPTAAYKSSPAAHSSDSRAQ
jgi:hypothetical protein